MVLEADVKTRLLTAIETNTLVFLCGAGLSVPEPSNLPSAACISRHCYDLWNPIEPLDPAMRDNVDVLAGHFWATGRFQAVFINRLVPWNDLVGRPNSGHEAVADFLITHAAFAALTTNFDVMIESWAEAHKIALQGALNDQEAVSSTSATSPLIKVHGCLHLGRDETLWTHSQLAEPHIRARLASCSKWMSLFLPGKDLVVVGFWTDWEYLNDALAGAFKVGNARTVTVIDPKPTAQLQADAPELWAKLQASTGVFEHVRGSGAAALDELRTAFSKGWVQRYHDLGRVQIAKVGGTAVASTPFAALTGNELYDLRRDAEGVPYDRAALAKEPHTSATEASYLCIMLLQVGATLQGAWFHHDGRSIRVVNGGGQEIATMRERYKEPPAVNQSDIVVCAGAFDLGLPGRVIASGLGSSAIRPASGGTAQWLTTPQARAEFGL